MANGKLNLPLSADTCCRHRSSDHDAKGNNSPELGAPCTVPGCRCKGWVSRKRGAKAFVVKDRRP